MPHIIAICPTCSATTGAVSIRYQSSRDYGPSEKFNPADFVPKGTQGPAAPGQPTICSDCKTELIFQAASPRHDVYSNGNRAPKAPSAPLPSDPAVRVVFAVEPGEELRSMKEFPNDRMLVVTNRRIVVVDLELLAIKEITHG